MEGCCGTNMYRREKSDLKHFREGRKVIISWIRRPMNSQWITTIDVVSKTHTLSYMIDWSKRQLSQSRF